MVKEKEKSDTTHSRWEQEYAAFTRTFPERRSEFITSSGITVKPLYSAEDTKFIDYENDVGYPGSPPFTRGIRPSMYRGRFWTMRQYAGFGDAQSTNARYHYLLKQGQTGLSVAFDLPTQVGLDPDHELSVGEVGKVGVSIASLRDMERLFDGIPLDKVSTSMTINAPAAILLAMYQAVGEKQGVPGSSLRGTIQNDILKEYIARGTYIFPPKPSLRLITDVFEYCGEHLPRFNTISISGYHIREAGSTAVQEIAYTLADGIVYVQAAVERGLNVDQFAARLSFFFNVHNNFFEEIAKFRAARRLWAEIMRKRFNAKMPKSLMLRFHSQTAGSTLTAQEPENNVIRVTLQALAAVLGGTQSLHTNSRDEALSLPTEEAVRVALRTQQILAHESGVADTVDPIGGSFFVESLTESLYQKAKAEIDKIDEMGGMVRAIETGYVKKEIEKAAYKAQQAIESGDSVVVAVNTFADGNHTHQGQILKVDPQVQRRQITSLQQLRNERDNLAVQKALQNLRQCISSSQNCMPAIFEAVKCYATLGEIVGVMKEVFGEFEP